MQLAKGRFNRERRAPDARSSCASSSASRAQSYSDQCQPVTNPRLIAALETRQVGSFRVTMLRPALELASRRSWSG